jgi:hypothetical protein
LIDAAKAKHPHVGKVGVLAALKKQLNLGLLEPLQPSAGRRPAKYRKVSGAG